jgi:hypothetical protein
MHYLLKPDDDKSYNMIMIDNLILYLFIILIFNFFNMLNFFNISSLIIIICHFKVCYMKGPYNRIRIITIYIIYNLTIFISYFWYYNGFYSPNIKNYMKKIIKKTIWKKYY